MNRKSYLLIFLLVFALVLCGCDIDLDNESVRAKTETMLDCLLCDDYDGSYALVRGSCTDADYQVSYQQIQTVLGDTSTYELTAVGINKNFINGVSSTTVTYRMKTDTGSFTLTATESDNVEGLTGFYITADEQVNTTGTLTTMKGANWVQWVVMIIGLAEVTFVIWTLVDCCRRKYNQKWLWILMILFGAVILSFDQSAESLQFNVQIGLFLSSTSLIAYSNGAMSLRIMVPAGAICYLALRKKLLADASRSVPESIPTESATTSDESPEDPNE